MPEADRRNLRERRHHMSGRLSMCWLWGVGVLLGAGLPPGVARALSRQGARYLRSCESTIRIAGLRVIKAYETAPVDRRVQAHWSNLRKNLGRAIRACKRIPPQDRRDPAVQRVFRLLKALQDHYRILDARVRRSLAQAATSKRRYFAFKARYGGRRYQQAISVLRQIQSDPEAKVLVRMLPLVALRNVKPRPDRRRRFLEFVQAVRELGRACTGEFAGLRNARGYAMSWATDFEAWCRLAAVADRLLAKGVRAAAATRLASFVRQAEKVAAQLASKPGSALSSVIAERVVHPEEVERGYGIMLAEWSRLTGLKLVAGQYLGAWRAAAKKALEMIHRQAGRARRLARKRWRHRHRVAERLARKRVQSTFRARVRWSGMESKGWEVRKNRYGIPEYRYRNGIVVYRKRGEKLCRATTFSYRQKYLGRGRFQRSAELRLDTEAVRFLACR